MHVCELMHVCTGDVGFLFNSELVWNYFIEIDYMCVCMCVCVYAYVCVCAQLNMEQGGLLHSDRRGLFHSATS